MLGWEFPPFISGGLGTACYGLTRALDELDVKVTFVLPKTIASESKYSTHVRLLGPESIRNTRPFTRESVDIDEFHNVNFYEVPCELEPYGRPESYLKKVENLLRQHRKTIIEDKTVEVGEADSIQIGDTNYGGDMYREIERYAGISARLSANEDFDVIHAHDWMTFPAAITAAARTGKPLIVQVHSTEFDRSGEHVNQRIYEIERAGMHAANKIIAVSHFTKRIILDRYGISSGKVEVVHNGIDRIGDSCTLPRALDVDEERERLVLFLGRITMQKGPEYFLRAAKRVLEVEDNVRFVMAGSGDMMQRAIEMAAELGIGKHVLFTGFLRGKDVGKVYKMADIFVMPSVSEPFGIVPLEALNHQIPVIISKQSGVSEVLTHALKVDFWDTDEMANKIVSVLRYQALRMTLLDQGNYEVKKLKWKDSALKCINVYEQMLTAV
jgi:glycosyltransferase involved in cell wall biosynthesis